MRTICTLTQPTNPFPIYSLTKSNEVCPHPQSLTLHNNSASLANTAILYASWPSLHTLVHYSGVTLGNPQSKKVPQSIPNH